MSVAQEVASADPHGELASLFKFFYALPVGLAQLNDSGDFELINSEFVRLAHIVIGNFSMTNFFDCLRSLAPEIHTKYAGLAPAERSFHEQLIRLPQPLEGVEALACSLSALTDRNFIVVLRDATMEFRRLRELQFP